MAIKYSNIFIGLILLQTTFSDVFGQQQSYEKVAVSENIAFDLTEQVYSTLRCAAKCLDTAQCLGFHSAPGMACHLTTCVNPNLLNSSGTDVSAQTAYIDVDSTTEVNISLARGKSASMSSMYRTQYNANKAVDGFYEPSDPYSSMILSNVEYQPWWRVDLQDIYCVWAVKITNRYGENYWERLRDAIVTVARTLEEIFYVKGQENNFCNYHNGILDRYETLMTCGKAIRGQFVQILLNATTALNVHEIEVHGL